MGNTRIQKLAAKCVKDAQATLGHGWDHVSEDIRFGLVSANIIAICIEQDDEHVSDASVRRLLNELNAECRHLIYGE